MTQCHIKELMENNFEFTENDQTGQTAIENSMPPEIPLRSQIDRLTRNHVVNISREQDLTKVIYLNLFNNKLRKIEGIKALVNLETLILAFNEIDMIEGLECNPNLRKLDLGHNFIRKIEHLDHTSQCIHLDLSHNWIEDIN
jgi:hypothetical protein